MLLVDCGGDGGCKASSSSWLSLPLLYRLCLWCVFAVAASVGRGVPYRTGSVFSPDREEHGENLAPDQHTAKLSTDAIYPLKSECAVTQAVRVCVLGTASLSEDLEYLQSSKLQPLCFPCDVLFGVFLCLVCDWLFRSCQIATGLPLLSQQLACCHALAIVFESPPVLQALAKELVPLVVRRHISHM